jgi:hypothetical protein
MTPPSAPSSAGTQRTEGEGKEATHMHGAVTHVHDHYHITHHHRGGDVSPGAADGREEWEHRTSWHTHAHSHHSLTHSHDYSQDDEAQRHGKEAHTHDHAAPTASG